MDSFSTPPQPIRRTGPPPVRQNRYNRISPRALTFDPEETYQSPPSKKRKSIDAPPCSPSHKRVGLIQLFENVDM